MTSDSTPAVPAPMLPDLPEQMARTAKELIDAATVRRAFGEPVVRGERTVIPMASVSMMIGFGGGSGSGSGPGGEGSGSGSGSGGGGRARATPDGVIELDADGVHIHLSPNRTARLVTTIALVIAWNAFWLLYTIRRVRQLQADARPTA